MDTFDFSEALSCMKAGMKVKINFNNQESTFYINEHNNIVSTDDSTSIGFINSEVILSDQWELVNE